jgi:hypothetical protein
MNHLTYHHHPEKKQSDAAKVEEADLVETLEQKLKTNLVFQISPITKMKKLNHADVYSSND